MKKLHIIITYRCSACGAEDEEEHHTTGGVKEALRDASKYNDSIHQCKGGQAGFMQPIKATLSEKKAKTNPVPALSPEDLISLEKLRNKALLKEEDVSVKDFLKGLD